MKRYLATLDEARAFADGRTSQLRKPVDPRGGENDPMLYDLSRAFVYPSLGHGPYLKVPFCQKGDGWEDDPDGDTYVRVYCHYLVGDDIWVAETIRFSNDKWRYAADDEPCLATEAPGACADPDMEASRPRLGDYTTTDCVSSALMPQWASRTHLRVIGVSVEKRFNIWTWVIETEKK